MATAPAVIGGTTPSHAPAERGLRPADQVSLRVLGRFELHVDGRRHEVPWQAQRVLGYLAVGGVAQPRATVAGALWGDVSQRRAQANLRNAVWRVRQLSDRVLAGGRDVIALDGRVALDLRDAQRRAQTLLGDDDTAADVAGIDLLDDDLLPAWDEPWLLIERERQRQLRMHALERLSASLLRAERYPQAITAALAAVRAEPLRESSQRALIAAHLARERDRLDEAREQLASAARARRRGPVDLRSRAWHAEALVRLAAGDRRGAESALRAGMRVLHDFRGALGATELRAHASAHAGDAARLGLRLAVEERRADRALAWAERWRAGALQLRPVRPPDDTVLEGALAELRRVVSRIGQEALAGRDITGLRRRQAGLEQLVQRRARLVAGGAYALPPPPAPAELSALLGERALVEVVALDRRLHAVVLAGGRLTLHGLGELREVTAEMAALRFGLRRLAFAHGSAASLEAAAGAVAYAAGRLDELLVGPLLERVGGRPLVLVPTGVLHALPWSALPSLQDRPVSVAPSAALWRRAAETASSSRDGRVVIVEGPELPGAAGEVAALARRYPDATCLVGPAATVAATATALDGAALAHVAAHGAFRVDNPLFSSLQLADGPLTVYDLEGLARAPRRLVLSACDAGLSGVRPGDELMGLAGALFALGMSTLVASVIPVPDAATKELMLALHRALQGGAGPAEALARARSGQDPAVAASFVCFGAG